MTTGRFRKVYSAHAARDIDSAFEYFGFLRGCDDLCARRLFQHMQRAKVIGVGVGDQDALQISGLVATLL